MPWSEIQPAEEVHFLHREEWWAWWSDEWLLWPLSGRYPLESGDSLSRRRYGSPFM